MEAPCRVGSWGGGRTIRGPCVVRFNASWVSHIPPPPCVRYPDNTLKLTKPHFLLKQCLVEYYTDELCTLHKSDPRKKKRIRAFFEIYKVGNIGIKGLRIIAKINSPQGCIPVGCVSPPYCILWYTPCLRIAFWDIHHPLPAPLHAGMHTNPYLPHCMLGYTTKPLVDRMTDTCKNITLLAPNVVCGW